MERNETKATLIHSKSGWSIRYLSGSYVDTVKRAFGSDTIPLPFTADASLHTVMQSVTNRQPGLILDLSRD